MESFWDFSIRTYRTPGVPDACLSLQNDNGADVNMVLYCCWIGAVIGAFDDRLFNRASDYSAHWAKNVVIPLREARTWMKLTGCDADLVPTDSCMELRENVKTVEFAAEKMQQEVLESMASVENPGSDTPDHMMKDVVANLHLYAEYIGLNIQNDVKQKFLLIIEAAYPTWDTTELKGTLNI